MLQLISNQAIFCFAKDMVEMKDYVQDSKFKLIF